MGLLESSRVQTCQKKKEQCFFFFLSGRLKQCEAPSCCSLESFLSSLYIFLFQEQRQKMYTALFNEKNVSVQKPWERNDAFYEQKTDASLFKANRLHWQKLNSNPQNTHTQVSDPPLTPQVCLLVVFWCEDVDAVTYLQAGLLWGKHGNIRWYNTVPF